MAVSKARERSYLRALMYLGPAPKAYHGDAHAGVDDMRVTHRVDAYVNSMSYANKVEKYFLKHVFQGMTSALGNTDNWIEGFYSWQRATIVELQVHDEVIMKEYH